MSSGARQMTCRWWRTCEHACRSATTGASEAYHKPASGGRADEFIHLCTCRPTAALIKDFRLPRVRSRRDLDDELGNGIPAIQMCSGLRGLQPESSARPRVTLSSYMFTR